MPAPADASATEFTITTRQQHLAAVPSSDLASPACTVSQVFKNGRNSTTLGEKVTDGSVATHGNCELIAAGTKFHGPSNRIIANTVKIKLAGEAQANALRAGLATAKVGLIYSA